MAVFSSKKALARCQDLRLLDLYHRSGLYTRYTAQNVQKRSYFRYLRMRNDETRINIKGHAAALYWPYTKKSRDLHPFPIPFLPLSMIKCKSRYRALKTVFFKRESTLKSKKKEDVAQYPVCPSLRILVTQFVNLVTLTNTFCECNQFLSLPEHQIYTKCLSFNFRFVHSSHAPMLASC